MLNVIAVTPNPDDLRLQFVDVEVERCTAWKAFEVGSTLLEAGTGPFPLGAHARVESLFVNFDAPFLGKLAGKFQRKAKRVVKSERILTSNSLSPSRDLLELLQTLLQGLLESRSFRLDRDSDLAGALRQLRIRLAEQVRNDHDSVRQRSLHIDSARVY